MRPFTKICVCALLLLLLVGCVNTGSVKRSSRSVSSHAPVPISASQRNDFNKALSFMKKDEYAKALPLLEGIVKQNDGLPGTNINLAICYMKLAVEDDKVGYQKAEEALKRAIDVNPKNETAQFQLGLLYRKTGRFDQSRKAYEQALKLDNTYAIAHYNLAVLCDIYLQQLKCAVMHFEKYQQLAPEDSKQVNMWLTDLRRRAGIPEPKAPETAASKEG